MKPHSVSRFCVLGTDLAGDLVEGPWRIADVHDTASVNLRRSSEQ
eukprot:SAG11_NODE_37924_length_254_cov_1.477419_1_plen_44_part_10